MKKTSGSAVYVLLLALFIACGSLNKPQEFKSDAGGFSVMSPVPLKEENQSINTPAGNMDLHSYSAESGNRAYIVAYTDLPADITSRTDPQKLLDGSRDGAVNNVNGKLIYENKISQDGNPGRELVIDAKASNGQDATAKAHIFLVKNRLYQVLTVAPKGEVSGSEMDQFLNSFKLLGK